MDQLVTVDEFYHVYKHPLSIFIHLKYQDKDGCSRNGSNAFLKELGYVNMRGYAYHVFDYRFDHRGVFLTFRLEDTNPISQELETKIFNFKQIMHTFVRSSKKVKKKQVTALHEIYGAPNGIPRGYFKQWVKYPGTEKDFAMSACGNIIGLFTTSLVFRESTYQVMLPSFEKLPHLRSLVCLLDESTPCSEEMFEAFGRSFGHKLTHLYIGSDQPVLSLSQLTKLKSLEVEVGRPGGTTTGQHFGFFQFISIILIFFIAFFFNFVRWIFNFNSAFSSFVHWISI